MQETPEGKDGNKTEFGFKKEKRERSAVLKEKMVKMIESGLQLSEYQARKAFTVYLQCILQRLSDFDEETGDSSQIDLVLKFLQKVGGYNFVETFGLCVLCKLKSATNKTLRPPFLLVSV